MHVKCILLYVSSTVEWKPVKLSEADIQILLLKNSFEQWPIYVRPTGSQQFSVLLTLPKFLVNYLYPSLLIINILVLSSYFIQIISLSIEHIVGTHLIIENYLRSIQNLLPSLIRILELRRLNFRNNRDSTQVDKGMTVLILIGVSVVEG